MGKAKARTKGRVQISPDYLICGDNKQCPLCHPFATPKSVQLICFAETISNVPFATPPMLQHEETRFSFLSELSRIWDGRINAERLMI